MVQKNKPNGPLTGWIEAGSELIAEQLSGVTEQINRQLDAQKKSFDELQQRGASMDAHLRSSLSPSAVLANMEQLVKTSPLWSFVPSFTAKRDKREQQLDVLSAKVDVLVEQVALLAAKQAQEKAQAKQEAEASAKVKTKDVAEKVDSAATAVKSASAETPEKPSRRPSTRKKTATSTPGARPRSVSSVRPKAR